MATATSAPTETSAGDGTAASTPTPDSRFIPGTVLAKRYRVVGLLGVGGMGEVYRADDLKLGQPVALKFLPQAVERNQARLERFLNEVKTALKVSHPNVCRVHDIGEIEGQHYLRMILRRQWLATVGYCAIFCAFNALSFAFIGMWGTNPAAAIWVGVITGLIGSILAIYILIRYGVLAHVAAVLFNQIMITYPLTTDITAPYFTSSLIAPAFLLAIGLYAFKVSLAGRPLFKES
jgi:serine/threonine protein kinase